ncbi:MAG: hypothetical protein K0S04_451 [Herbinix sp.]|nr:hypothetical protein [Herbinix sp.]
MIYKQPIATHQQEMIAALFSLSYFYCAAVVTAIVASVEVDLVVMAVAVFF